MRQAEQFSLGKLLTAERAENAETYQVFSAGSATSAVKSFYSE
jgi:hypothetical protein